MSNNVLKTQSLKTDTTDVTVLGFNPYKGTTGSQYKVVCIFNSIHNHIYRSNGTETYSLCLDHGFVLGFNNGKKNDWKTN